VSRARNGKERLPAFASQDLIYFYTRLYPQGRLVFSVNGIVIDYPPELSLSVKSQYADSAELLLRPSPPNHLPLPLSLPAESSLHADIYPPLTINTPQPPPQIQRNTSWSSHHVLIKRWKVMVVLLQIQYRNGTMGLCPNSLEVMKVQSLEQWQHYRIVSLLPPRI
jgi:hypothetical protein